MNNNYNQNQQCMHYRTKKEFSKLWFIFWIVVFFPGAFIQVLMANTRCKDCGMLIK